MHRCHQTPTGESRFSNHNYRWKDASRQCLQRELCHQKRHYCQTERQLRAWQGLRPIAPLTSLPTTSYTVEPRANALSCDYQDINDNHDGLIAEWSLNLLSGQLSMWNHALATEVPNLVVHVNIAFGCILRILITFHIHIYWVSCWGVYILYYY